MAVDPSVESHVPAPSGASVSGWRWRVLHLVWRSLWAAFLVAWVLTMLHTIVGVPLSGVLEQVRRLALVLSLPAWLSPIARYLGVDRELLSRSLRFWGGRLAFGGAILIWLGLVIAVTLFMTRVQIADSLGIQWVSLLGVGMVASGLVLAFAEWCIKANRDAIEAYRAGHPDAGGSRGRR